MRATAVGAGAVVFLLLGVGGALAMHPTTSSTLLARSRDGASQLYEVRVAGPEGGGSLGYRVQGRRSEDRAEYLLSSNFSPGGPTRPQTVSIAECEKRLGALDDDLRRRGFAGVSTHPEGCRHKSRSALVTVGRP